MARKNLLSALTATTPAVAKQASVPLDAGRTVSPFATRGAPGMLTRSIGAIAAKAEAAKELEERLTSGQVIVELDTALIDPSFIADRMAGNDEAYQALRTAIVGEGQISPILVRPHPKTAGRYQVAFGHRRLRVAKDLERPVKAVVRSLTDQELILAQGQENSARADLSFIERARFARRLEDMGYGREVIMSALAVDKAMVSRMISVTAKIPSVIIDAIGPAPGTGRDRWMDLANRFVEDGKETACSDLLESKLFQEADSDARFMHVLNFVLSSAAASVERIDKKDRPSPRQDIQQWGPSAENARIVRLTHNAHVVTLSIDRHFAPGFGEYLLSQMDRLFIEYSSAKMPRANVDRDPAVDQRAGKASLSPANAPLPAASPRPLSRGRV
jgi:ParB family transcriptional regulator, chromosome partitioning protein